MKYRITLEMNVYADVGPQAMTKAIVHLHGVLGSLAATPLQAWGGELPTATILGAPHAPDALSGWGCIVTLDEYAKGR